MLQAKKSPHTTLYFSDRLKLPKYIENIGLIYFPEEDLTIS